METTVTRRTQTLNERQDEEMSTCMESCHNLVYPVMGAIEELGELAEKIEQFIQYREDATTDQVLECKSILTDMQYLGKKAKKLAKGVRHQTIHPPFISISECSLHEYMNRRAEVIYEVGDVHWMLDGILEMIGCSAQLAADMNAEKLMKRKERHEIDGNGDHERTRIE